MSFLPDEIPQDSYTEENETTSPFLDKHVSIRIVVGITCFLSMLGALLVVLSYLCIKSIRSQGRLILLNLALMDFGVGLFNLVGAAANFDEYYYNLSSKSLEPLEPSKAVDVSCLVQAVLAHYCTASSILWTACLAVYMYILVFQNYRKNVKLYLPLSCLVCYGIPLGLTLWLLLTERLGHSPYNEAAWCGIIIVDRTSQLNLPDYFAAVIGYDLWIYLTFFISLAIYSALFCYLHVEFGEARGFVGSKEFWKRALQFLDIKLIFIPLAFIILRLWSCILNILLYYMRIPPDDLPDQVSQALIYLSGIGDSGQGLANGLLFVIFTADVRSKLLFGCLRKRNNEINIIEPPTRAGGNDETEHLLKNKRFNNNSLMNSPYSSIYESDVDIRG